MIFSYRPIYGELELSLESGFNNGSNTTGGQQPPSLPNSQPPSLTVQTAPLLNETSETNVTSVKT